MMIEIFVEIEKRYVLTLQKRIRPFHVYAKQPIMIRTQRNKNETHTFSFLYVLLMATSNLIDLQHNLMAIMPDQKQESGGK